MTPEQLVKAEAAVIGSSTPPAHAPGGLDCSLAMHPNPVYNALDPEAKYAHTEALAAEDVKEDDDESA